MIARTIKIMGDVQGVSYRYFARLQAKSLGLVGWAQNEHDGSVRIFAQGPKDQLDTFLTWAKIGSPMATVREVLVEEDQVNSAIKRFEVK